MKRIILVFTLFAAVSSIGARKSHGWDLPLNVEVYEISFNYNTSSTSSDGINICSDGGSSITAPEWSLRGQTNKKIAYLMSTSNSGPTVKAKFYFTESGITSLTIFTVGTAGGNPGWELDETNVSFGDSIGYFSSSSLENSVNQFDVYWAWRVGQVNGVQQSPSIYIDNSYHDGYIVLSTPQSPMQQPWVGVLDKACYWAAGETSSNGVASDVTYGVYNYLADQDGDLDYVTVTSYSSGFQTFYLTSFLDSLSISSNVCVNCTDVANIFCIFSSALGCSSTTKRIYTSAQDTLYTESIDPIGNANSWAATIWSYHQIGWLDNLVDDACIRVNQGSPILPSNMIFTPTYMNYLLNPDNQSYSVEGPLSTSIF